MSDKPQWQFTTRIQGNRVEVYVADEHGGLLNTDPVCVIFADHHPWFVKWLGNQPCEYPVGYPYETYQT